MKLFISGGAPLDSEKIFIVLIWKIMELQVKDAIIYTNCANLRRSRVINQRAICKIVENTLFQMYTVSYSTIFTSIIYILSVLVTVTHYFTKVSVT